MVQSSRLCNLVEYAISRIPKMDVKNMSPSCHLRHRERESARAQEECVCVYIYVSQLYIGRERAGALMNDDSVLELML